jgi:hypothetical protein
MRERELKQEWVEDAIANPDWTEADPAGPGIARSFKAIPQRDNRVLRVVWVETPEALRVITAFLDRRARRRP